MFTIAKVQMKDIFVHVDVISEEVMTDNGTQFAITKFKLFQKIFVISRMEMLIS